SNNYSGAVTITGGSLSDILVLNGVLSNSGTLLYSGAFATLPGSGTLLIGTSATALPQLTGGTLTMSNGAQVQVGSGTLLLSNGILTPIGTGTVEFNSGTLLLNNNAQIHMAAAGKLQVIAAGDADRNGRIESA